MNVSALPAAAASRARLSASPGLVLIGCAVVAVALQALFIPVDADVSWLITVSERVLAGDRLYVDIFEVNPPASVWIYVPQVWLAQLCEIRPEAMVVLLAAGTALLSGFATLKLSQRMRERLPSMVTAAAIGFAVLLLPCALFAQREHYALLLALPCLAAMALVAEERALSRSEEILTGIAAGVVCALKPHFAAAMLLPAAWSWSRRRSIRPLLPSALTALLVIALYAAAALIFAADYLTHLDLLSQTYMPMREHWLRLARGPSLFIPVACWVLVLLLRPSRTSPFAATLLLGMTGFALAALVQGKGYANHALPATALGLLGVIVLLIAGDAARERRRMVAVAVAGLAATQLYTNSRIGPPEGLVETLKRVAPPSPTVITLGTELATGHPVVRLVGGRWVGSRASLFTVAGVQYGRSKAVPLAERRRLDRWYDEDVQSFVRDARQNRPDVVLVERSEKSSLLRDASVAQVMRSYRRAAAAGEIEVWLRRR